MQVPESAPPSRTAVVLALGVLGVLLSYGTARASDSVDVRVRGSVRVEAEREETGEVTRISGVVYDDLGRPLTSAVVRFPRVVRACGSGSPPSAEIPVRVSGDFCVELPSESVPESVEVSAPDHESASLALHELPPRSATGGGRLEIVELADVWEPEAVERSWTVGFRWRGQVRATAVRGKLVCSQSHHTLFVRDLEGTGPTYVAIDTDPQAAAGPCRVELETTDGASSAFGEILIRRPVGLRLESTESGRYAVRATTSASGAVGGMLEVRGADDRYIAGATLENSVAALDLGHVPDERLIIHHRPNQPWFAQGAALTVDHVAPRAFFRETWFHASVLSGLVALVLARFVRKETGKTPSPLVAALAPVAAPARRRRRVHGRVVDGHTEENVALATLRLFERTATESRLLGEQTSDAEGAFAFEPKEANSLELEVSSPNHVTVRLPVRPGHVDVALVARRRALLGAFRKFVQHRQLGRTSPGPFPTPERVRLEATLEARQGDADWAEAIDQLAYGPEEPAERAVEALAMFPGRNHER